MTDPNRFPLETSHGVRPRSGAGERVLVGLAVVALLAGLAVAVGNLLNPKAETAQASPRPTPAGTPTPLPTPTPPVQQTIQLLPGTPPLPQAQRSSFYGWIRARADLVIHSSPDPESGSVGTLAEGELAYGQEGELFETPPDWLLIDSPVAGWIDGTPGLVFRYEQPQVEFSGSIYALAAGADGFMALGTSPYRSNTYVPPSPMVSGDGIAWSSAYRGAFAGGYVNSVAWGPAGWLAAGTVERMGAQSQVWMWSSPDGLRWKSLGRMPAGSADWVNQVVASDHGYLLETGSNSRDYGDGPSNLWFSADGLTWKEETPNPGAGGGYQGWRRTIGLPSGFYTWSGRYDPVIGYPTPSTDAGAFSAEGQTWTRVEQGPRTQTMALTGVGDGALAIDLDEETGTPMAWIARVVDARLVWHRDYAAERAFTGTVVTALAWDGHRTYAFGWDRRTEGALVWTDYGAGWTRSSLPDSFGGFPRTAVAGPQGVVVVGTRPTMRAENPVFWHRTAAGHWLPEPQPLFHAVPDPGIDECPPLPHELVEFTVLDSAVALVCFGHTPITFRGWSVGCDGCFGYGPGVSEPAWLMAPGDNQLYLSPIEPQDPSGWSISMVLAPSVAREPAWSTGTWIEVTGHFDDPAAATCRYQPVPQELTFVAQQWSYIETCMRTFVVTEVRDVSGA